MDGQSSRLPWEALWARSEEIPWDAMTAFADAAAAEPSVVDELFGAYDQADQKAKTEECYMDLYAPAILAMALPKLSQEHRHSIGKSLVRRLIEQERSGDDLHREALVSAAGTLGPAILPLVLDAVEQEADLACTWLDTWKLTALAVQTRDAELRERVVRTCVDLLDRIDHDRAESWGGMGAARTLALLGRTEHVDLLERLRDRYDESFEGGDYGPSVNRMRGMDDPEDEGGDEGERLWEQPVREWFPPLWKWAKDWFVARDRRERDFAALPADDGLEETVEPARVPEPAFVPPVPIVNVSPKIGRNDPCPCGSGKKYKKCCGRTAQDHAGSGV